MTKVDLTFSSFFEGVFAREITHSIKSYLFLQLCKRKRRRVMETGSGSHQLWSDQDPRAALNFLLDKVGGKTVRLALSRRLFALSYGRVSDSDDLHSASDSFLIGVHISCLLWNFSRIGGDLYVGYYFVGCKRSGQERLIQPGGFHNPISLWLFVHFATTPVSVITALSIHHATTVTLHNFFFRPIRAF